MVDEGRAVRDGKLRGKGNSARNRERATFGKLPFCACGREYLLPSHRYSCTVRGRERLASSSSSHMQSVNSGRISVALILACATTIDTPPGCRRETRRRIRHCCVCQRLPYCLPCPHLCLSFFLVCSTRLKRERCRQALTSSVHACTEKSRSRCSFG